VKGRQTLATLASLRVRFGADISDFERAVRAVRGHADGLTSSFRAAAVAGAAFGAAATAMNAVLSAIGTGAKTLGTFTANLQMARAAWATMLGSQEKAEAALLRFQEVAAKTPFGFEDIEKGNRRLVALGFNFREAQSIMEAIINASSSLNLTSEQINRVALALGQIRTAGRIYAQDMNQLIAAGIPAWEILADSINKTVGETRKLAEAGKLNSAQFIAAFEAWGKMPERAAAVEAASRTFNGAIQTVKDNLLAIGETAMRPLVDQLARMAYALGQFTGGQQFRDWAAMVAAAVTVVMEQLAGLAGAVSGSMGTVTSILQSAGQAAYDALQWINPFATHSPSLVESVDSGVTEIVASYSRIPGEITPPLQQGYGAIQAFLDAAAAGMAAWEQQQRQTTATTLAIFGEDVPAAYLAAMAALDQMRAALGPLEAAVSAQEGVVKRHAAAVAEAQAAVDAQEAAIRRLERAMRPLEQAVEDAADALDAARDAFQAAKDEVDRLEQALDDARQRLQDFANTPIAGTKAFADALFALEQEIAAVELALLEWKLSPELAATVADFEARIAAADAAVEEWEGRVAAAEAAVEQQAAVVKAAEQSLKGYENAVKAARGAVEAQRDRVNAAKEAVQEYAARLADARNRLKEFGSVPIAGTQKFADALFEIDQRAAAIQRQLVALKLDGALAAEAERLTGAIREQEASIAAAERGLEDYAAAQDDAARALETQAQATDAAKQRVDEYTASLEEVRQTIDELAGKDLQGTGEFADQLFALDQQAKQIELTMTEMRLGGASKNDLASLQEQLEMVRLEAEKVQLQESLQLDPLRRQVDRLANPLEELPFDAVIEGIRNAQGQERDLTEELTAAQQEWEAQNVLLGEAQANLDATSAAHESAADAINVQKKALEGLEAALAAVRDQQSPAALADELEKLQLQAEATRLDEQLQLEPLRRQIEALLNPTKELTFQEIVNGINSTRAEIAQLEPALAGAESALAAEEAALAGVEAALRSAEAARDAQKGVVDAEKAALDALNDTLDREKAGLSAAEEAAQALRDAMEDATTPPKELTDELERLRLEAERTRLLEILQLGPLRKEIEDLANPVKELTFEEIVNGITAAQQEIATLEPALAAATQAMNDQETAVQAATAAHEEATRIRDEARDAIDKEREALQDLRDTLQGVQDAHDIENKKLQDLKSQYSDAEKAIRDYESAINAIVQGAKGQAASPPAGDTPERGPKDGGYDFTEYQNKLANARKVFDEHVANFRAMAAEVQEVVGLIGRAVGSLFEAFSTGEAGDFEQASLNIQAVLNAVFGPEQGLKMADTVDTIVGFLAKLRDAAVDLWNKVEGPLTTFVTFVRDHFFTITRVIGAMALTWQTLSAVGTVIAAVLAGVGVVVAALTSPVTLAAIVITALVGAFVGFYSESSRFRDIVAQVADFITGTFLPALGNLAGAFMERAVPAARAFGDFITGTFLPALGTLAAMFMEHVMPVIERFVGFVGEHFGTIATVVGTFIGVFAGMQVLIPIVTTVAGAIGTVVSVISGLATFIGAVGLGPALSTLFAPLLATLGGVGPALLALINPVTAVAAVIAGLVAGFVWLWRENETFREGVKTVIATVKNWASVLADVAGAIGGKVLDGLRRFGDLLRTTVVEGAERAGDVLGFLGNMLMTYLRPAWDSIVEAFQRSNLSETFAVLQDAFAGIGDTLGRTGESLLVIWGHIQTLAQGVGGVLLPYWDLLRQGMGWLAEQIMDRVAPAWDMLQKGIGFLMGNLDKLTPVLMVIGAFIIGPFVGAFAVLVGTLSGLAEGLGNFISGLALIFTGAFQVISGVIDSIVAIFRASIQLVTGVLTGDGEMVKDAFIDLFEGLKKSGTQIIEGFKNAVVGLFLATFGTVLGALEGFVLGIWNFLKGLYDDLVGHSLIPDLVNDIMKWFQDLWDRGKQLFKDLVADLLGIVTTWVSDTVSAITEFVTKTIPDTIAGGWTLIKNAFMAIFKGAGSVLEAFGEWEIEVIKNIWEFISVTVPEKFFEGQEAVRTFFMQIFDGAGSVWEAVWAWGDRMIQAIWTFISVTVPQRFFDGQAAVRDFIMKIFDGAGSVWEAVWAWGDRMLTAIGTFIITTVPNKFLEGLDEVQNAIMAPFRAVFGDNKQDGLFKTWWGNMEQGAADFISGMVTKLGTVAKDLTGAIMAPFETALKKMPDWGLDMANRIVGILNQHIGPAFASMANKAINVINTVAGWLGIDELMEDYVWSPITPFARPPDWPALAKGTTNWRGGVSLVGEEGPELGVVNGRATMLGAQGPELVNLPTSAVVVPNKWTNALLRAGVPGYAEGKNWEYESGNKWSDTELPIPDFLDPIIQKLIDHGINPLDPEWYAAVARGAIGPFKDIFDLIAGGPFAIFNKAAQVAGWNDDIWQSMPGKGWQGLGKGMFTRIGAQLVGEAQDYLIQAFPFAFRGGGGGGVNAAGYAFPVVGYSGAIKTHWDSGERGAADLFAAKGTPVVAMMAGIGDTGFEPLYGGNYASIKGVDGLDFYYAHMDRLVWRGGSIGTGEQIGTVGDTGNAAGTGDHLHLGVGYGIRRGGGAGGGAGLNFDLTSLLQSIQSGVGQLPGQGDGGPGNFTPAPAPPGHPAGLPNLNQYNVNDIINATRRAGASSQGLLAMVTAASMEGGWSSPYGVGDFSTGGSYGPWQINWGANRVARMNAENPYWAAPFMWGTGSPSYSGGGGPYRLTVPWAQARYTDLVDQIGQAIYRTEAPEVYYGNTKVAQHLNKAQQAIGMANGGIISEPIVGRGAWTGTTYAFGENGDREYVLNEDQMAARGPGTSGDFVNVQHIHGMRPGEVQRETERAWRRVLVGSTIGTGG
jgi:tape measure domain-containing protein